MLDHAHYEMQSALAAAGQLPDNELIELEQHCHICSACRGVAAEMGWMSQQLFLVEARTATAMKVPEGMQERFQQRAGLQDRASVLPDLRYLGLAFAAMIVLSSLSWKMVSRRDAAAAIVSEVSLSAPRKEDVALTPAAGARQGEVRRRPARKRRSSARSVELAGATHSYLSLYQPSLQLPVRPMFLKVDGVGLWKPEGISRGMEHPFHYDLKLASLSLLDDPHRSRLESISTSLQFVPPVFHLDLSRAW